MKVISLIIGIMTLSMLACNPTEIKETTSSSRFTLSSSSSGVAQDPTQCMKYDRDLYFHWYDLDGDCQDARDEALNHYSLSEDSEDCEITTGEWYDPYSNTIFTDPSELDVDHIVPLAEAHRSGAYAWSPSKRKEFANDLENLYSVSASENRSKGDRDLSDWLPSSPKFHWEYVRTWMSIKEKYELTVDSAEYAVYDSVMTAYSDVGIDIETEEEVNCTGEILVQIEIDSDCGTKTTCGEMDSCEEATFYLEQCGLNKLDGDGDGTPCESVCGG